MRVEDSAYDIRQPAKDQGADQQSKHPEGSTEGAEVGIITDNVVLHRESLSEVRGVVGPLGARHQAPILCHNVAPETSNINIGPWSPLPCNFFPEIRIIPLGQVEYLVLLLGTVVLGLEVGVHGPVHPGGVGGQVEIDDQPEEPDLEPTPFSN